MCKLIKGIVPSREWKRKEYTKDPQWKDADMVYASIRQSGVRPTPIQMMYAITGVGMDGKGARPLPLPTPRFANLLVLG